MNVPVDYKESEDWEDIGMIAGVPNPGGVLSSTTEKRKQQIHYVRVYVSMILY